MDDTMKVVKSSEKSSLLIKGVSETIENKVKEQKVRFLTLLLGTLGASLLENILAGKGVVQVSEGTQSHPLTNFETQKYYQNEPNLKVFIQEITSLK